MTECLTRYEVRTGLTCVFDLLIENKILSLELVILFVSRGRGGVISLFKPSHFKFKLSLCLDCGFSYIYFIESKIVVRIGGFFRIE